MFFNRSTRSIFGTYMKIGLISFKNGSSCPPLGMVQLATYLRQEEYETDVLDFNWIDDFKVEDYDLVGISAMTKNYTKAIQLAHQIKERKNIPVVIGGVHISTLPESINPIFSGAIIGEGEKSFLQYLKTQKIPIPPPISMSYIDRLPLPDWDLVDQRYFEEAPNTTFGECGVEGVILTSRGCPYKCVFCSTQKFWGNKVKFHSAEYVEKLVLDLKWRGVTHIQIWDDLFTINRKRLKELVPPLKKTGIKFNCQPRTDLIDDELCEMLVEMGVRTCIFGFESGSNKMLGYLKNNTTTVSDNYNAIKLCRKHGLGVQGSVITKIPGEKEIDKYYTKQFINLAYKEGVERIWSFNLTPFPGTELWERTKVNWQKPGFDWGILVHTNQNTEFVELERKFKIRKALMFLRNDFWKTMKYSLKNIKNILNILWRGV